MIDRIIEVNLEQERIIASGNNLKGSAAVQYQDMVLTFPLSRDTIKAIEECIERDADTALKKMEGGS